MKMADSKIVFNGKSYALGIATARTAALRPLYEFWRYWLRPLMWPERYAVQFLYVLDCNGDKTRYFFQYLRGPNKGKTNEVFFHEQYEMPHDDSGFFVVAQWK